MPAYDMFHLPYDITDMLLALGVGVIIGFFITVECIYGEARKKFRQKIEQKIQQQIMEENLGA